MVYYNENGIIIHNLQQSDAQIITDEGIAQGWDANIEKYEMRLKHQAEGKSISLVAEYEGNIAGYIIYILIPNGVLLQTSDILKSVHAVIKAFDGRRFIKVTENDAAISQASNSIKAVLDE